MLSTAWKHTESNRPPYNRKQKHVLLFRKSTLKGCLKPRNVTKQDIFYSKILHAYAILEQGVLLIGGKI